MKITRSFYVLLALAIVPSFSIAQEKKSDAAIAWLSFEDAVEQNNKAPKKIFIDMYTEWCGWCKRMDKTTFQDPAVSAYMNKHFYAVKFDAERKDSILFKDQYFKFKPEYKSNELAAIMMNGQMSYPTSVYIDSLSNLIGPVPGYLTAEQFMPVLKYFAEDIYLTTKWDDYVKQAIK